MLVSFNGDSTLSAYVEQMILQERMDNLYQRLQNEGEKENKELDITSRFTTEGAEWVIRMVPQYLGEPSDGVPKNPFYGVDGPDVAFMS